MARVPFWLKLLLSVLTLRQSDAVYDQCSELQNEISGLERQILKSITELKNRKDIEVGQYYMSGLNHNRVICSPMLCEGI